MGIVTITDLVEFDEVIQEPEGEVLYRADGSAFTDGTVNIFWQSFRVTSRTPKGAWINVYGDRKFVLDSAQKRFAYPSREEAMASFVARKKRQIAILRDQLSRAERLLAAALAPDARQ